MSDCERQLRPHPEDAGLEGGNEFAVLGGDVYLVTAGGAAGVAFAGFGVEGVAHAAGAQESDVGREGEGKRAVRVGGCCQREVGQGKEGAALCASAGIEMLGGDGKAGFGITGFYFQQLHACIGGIAVVLEKFVGGHEERG